MSQQVLRSNNFYVSSSIFRIIPKWERVYCWLLIVLGIAGGCLATVQALLNIFSASMSAPCYLMDDPSNMTISGGGH